MAEIWVPDGGPDGGHWISPEHPGKVWSSAAQDWVPDGGGGGSTSGFDWSGSDSGPRTIEGNGPSGYGKYVLNPDGTLGAFIVSAIRPSTGSTTVVNAGTGGAHYTTMYGPEGYGTYETSTGTPILVGTKADPNAAVVDPRDRNNDQIDDSTGYALGVFKDTSGTSPSGYYYDPGNGSLVPVTPTGAPYHGPDLFPDKAGSAQVVGSAGGGYYERQKDGTWKLVIPGTSGPGSSGGGGTYSGGGGGSAGGGLTGGRTNTTVHAGGYNDVRTTNSTSYNTSDIGPNSLANSAAERAQRASEFAATYGLNRSREQRDAAATYAQLLSQVDPNAYQAFLEANGGGRLDNALLSGGNALSQNALRPAALALDALRGGPGGGLTGLATGGGLGSAAAGASGGGIPTAGAPGTPAAGNAPPAATAPVDAWTAAYGAPPAGYASWQDWLQVSGHGPAWLTGARGDNGQGIDLSTPESASQFAPWIQVFKQQQAAAGTPGPQPEYIDGQLVFGDLAAREPLRQASWRNGVLARLTAKGGGTQNYNPYLPGYTASGSRAASVAPPPDQKLSAPVDKIAQPPNTVPVYDNQFSQPYPELGKNADGTPVSPVQLAKAPHWDPATNQWVPTLAHGGLTRAPQMIVGDPQADGRPNPEVIVNPTNAPISVMPMRGMGGLTGMRHMMPDGTMMAGPPMGPGGGLTRMPRYAYGTDPPPTDQMTAYLEWLKAQNAEPTTAAAPTTTTATVTPVAAAAPALTSAAAAPTTTTTTAPATTATATPPSQIGNYSTAPGSAGQPVQTAAPTATAAAPTTSYSAPAIQTGPVATAEPSPASFDQVLYTRLAATTPWMQNPTEYMNVDYLTRDPVARRLYEQYLTLRYGVPQESIDFAIARNRLGGASLAAMSQGR